MCFQCPVCFEDIRMGTYRLILANCRHHLCIQCALTLFVGYRHDACPLCRDFCPSRVISRRPLNGGVLSNSRQRLGFCRGKLITMAIFEQYDRDMVPSFKSLIHFVNQFIEKTNVIQVKLDLIEMELQPDNRRRYLKIVINCQPQNPYLYEEVSQTIPVGFTFSNSDDEWIDED